MKNVLFSIAFILAVAATVLFAADLPAISDEAGLSEHAGLVTQKGAPVTLLGDPVKVGESAPGFVAIGNDMKPADLSAFKGKVVIISAVYSLDTPVCSMETRRFNEEASKLGDGVAVLTISMDLPMQQKHWCGAEGIDKIVTLSDYRYASFGKAYGMLIKGQRMLARGLFVVDREGKIRYTQLVKEIAQEPDYNEVIAAAKKLF